VTDLADRRGVETAVYQPAEDSRLLAAAALERVEPSDHVLDVGTGSGYVGARVAAETGAEVTASDLNPHACRAARDRGLSVVRGDLLDPFCADSFERVCFNPPYLPADGAATRDDWMEVALTGGESGRAVVEPFLDDVGRVLTPGGEALVLVSSLTGVPAVVERAGANGFSAAVLREASFPFETLSVLALML
jgi:release factor glutamine methyltransferase